MVASHIFKREKKGVGDNSTKEKVEIFEINDYIRHTISENISNENDIIESLKFDENAYKPSTDWRGKL